MTDITSPTPLARFVNGAHTAELNKRAEHGTFANHAEAEAKAREVADGASQDAVIVQDEQGFHVFATDEISSLLPGGRFSGEVIREAPIVSFVATDPMTGQENTIGQQSAPPAGAAPGAAATPAAKAAPTSLDRYAQAHGRQLDKLLGPEKDATLQEMNQLIQSLEAQGIKVTIELDDDIFENKDKLLGFKNLLSYANQNGEALQQRSIREIAIVDEWDNVFGTKVDLEYDKKTGSRRLELGDDFLDDWGESLQLNNADSVEKLSDALGATLSEPELAQRSAVFSEIRTSLGGAYDRLNQLQQASLQGQKPDTRQAFAELGQTLTHLETQVIPEARDRFGDFSVKQERQISEKYLDTFSDTVSSVRAQMTELAGRDDLQGIELNARLEKLKLQLLQGVKDMPGTRNYIGSYVGGMGDGSPPSAGLEYARSIGPNRETTASLRAGTSSPVGTGSSQSDIMLGLGVGHTFHSRNRLLDGANVGVGVGFGRETPFFIGASASNSWFLSDSHGLPGETSVVGGLNATVGTYTNVGGHLNVNRQLGERVEFEGYGELSLWNQAAEIEAEVALTDNKSVYLTGGVGTNKLIYGGIGVAGRYELEVGLGGISIGKDSDNLPGDSGWEVGLRTIPLPLPYFRHHRVPGYQFTYGDKSAQYVTPSGTFMAIQTAEDGKKTRQAYIPDPQASREPNQIVYRQVGSKAELDNLEQAPTRQITLGPLGYLTVVDNGETVIEDGLIKKPLSEAEMGIITDQAGVLWYDRMQPNAAHRSLGARREEMPLPLYRAVHR